MLVFFPNLLERKRKGGGEYLYMTRGDGWWIDIGEGGRNMGVDMVGSRLERRPIGAIGRRGLNALRPTPAK